MKKAKIIPEKAFFDKNDRRLLFATNISWLKIIRVRSFDVATFVAFGGADIGVADDKASDDFATVAGNA